MRLLFFIPDISTSGGVEKVVTALSSHLFTSYGYEVTILSCLQTNEKTFYYLDNNVQVLSLNAKPYPSGYIKRLLWYGQIIEKLDQHLISNGYNVILSEGTYLSLCLSLVKFRDIIKVGCEHIGFDSVFFLHKFFRRFLFKKLDALIVLTKKDLEYFSGFLNNVYEIPNFLTNIPSPPAKLNNSVIVSCGRLERQKGFDLLIEAFMRVNQIYPTWTLEIYGEGSERAELEKLIQNNGLCSSVYLRGQIKNVIEYLSKGSIFVLSSRYEGFPLVLLEAMSAGLPCISFDVDGVQELFKHQNGILVEKGNINELTIEMCNLISNEKLRTKMGEMAKRTSQSYNLEVVGEKWNRIIKKLTEVKRF